VEDRLEVEIGDRGTGGAQVIARGDRSCPAVDE
jgi:hypothetical protein